MVISAPATGEDVTVVMGVNDSAYEPSHTIVSNASCTTNCLAPLAKVLDDLVGIEKGLMTTIHGYALRVPIPTGSATDLTVQVRRQASVEEINEAYRTAAAGPLKGILSYAAAPIVSSDIVTDSASCIFDPGLTRVIDNQVKVLGWYDNEWGYSQRLVDLAALVASSL